jgi:hypothetical protein
MLDYRAWIVAGAILLSAAGAYLLWIYRPKATYNARSLTAGARHADAPATKSMHVEGCKDDFIVSPGELIEPVVVPGTPLEAMRSVYGQESKDGRRDKQGVLTWDKYEYSLMEGFAGEATRGDFLRLSMNSGHILETLDGVELGLDSFGTIFRKMRDKKVEVHERIRRDDDKWTLIVSLDSACGRKYRSEYFRSIPADAETDNKINRRVAGPDGKAGLLRSDVFMNKVPYDYVMETAESRDDALEGDSSEHD